jgi:hypothetical protein
MAHRPTDRFAGCPVALARHELPPATPPTIGNARIRRSNRPLFVDVFIWDRCYFLNIFAEILGAKMAFWAQNEAKLCKNLIITLVFEKNANFFPPKTIKM